MNIFYNYIYNKSKNSYFVLLISMHAFINFSLAKQFITLLIVLLIWDCSIYVRGKNINEAISTPKPQYNPRSITDIPNPMMYPALCGRSKVSKSSICDPDLILMEDDKDTIEGYINAVTRSQIGIIIINEMKFDRKTSYSRSNDADVMNMAKSFSTQIHNDWGIGSTSTNNGLLIFISLKDRVVYLSTGSGINSFFPVTVIDNIINNMKLYLKNQDYTQAILKCIVLIDLILSGKEKSELQNAYSTKYNDNNEIIAYVVYFGVIIFFGMCFYLKYEERQKLKNMTKGQVVLERLIKEVDGHSDQFVYHSTSCPICLELFPNHNTCHESTTTTINNHDLEIHQQSSTVINETELVKDTNINNSIEINKLSNRRPMGLQCGHTFCFECLEIYLKSNSGKVCPICRAPVDLQPSNHNHPIHQIPSTSNSGSGNITSHTTTPQPQLPMQSLGRQEYMSNHHRDHDFSNPRTTNRSQCIDTFEQESTITNTTVNNINENTYRNELLYRTERMHMLYPNTMTLELLRTIRLSLHNNSIYEFRNHLSSRQIETQRTITAIQQSIANAANNNGRSGASRSFGGGGHSGGGGGGGRW